MIVDCTDGPEKDEKSGLGYLTETASELPMGFVEPRRFELLTSALQRQRSTN
jgi:hypothetical protein